MILSTKLLRPRLKGTLASACCKCAQEATFCDVAESLFSHSEKFYCGKHAQLEDLDPDEYANQRVLDGAPVSRKMAFPECMDIEELFAKVPQDGPRTGTRLWCSVTNHYELESADLAPRPAVLEWIAANSIYGKELPLDKNHFIQINHWEDRGVALVTLKYQQIIGSHYLAIVPWETVEKFFGVRPQ
jgi:hypothetical protein